MSQLADKTYSFLKDIFPYYNINVEYYIKYKGQRLFFDFFIKELNLAVEVQGEQHYKFIKYFHEDREGFLRSKFRDNLKKEYCQLNDVILLYIHSEDELDKNKILEKILDLLKG